MDIAGYSVLFLVKGGYQGGETGMKNQQEYAELRKVADTIQLAITAARYARMTISNDDATRAILYLVENDWELPDDFIRTWLNTDEIGVEKYKHMLAENRGYQGDNRDRYHDHVIRAPLPFDGS